MKICKHQGCTRRHSAHGYCSSHAWQYKKYGSTWTIGDANPYALKDGFSTARFCPACKQTKHWTQYHLSLGVCADCHRASLKDEPVAQGAGMEYVLNFIQKQCRI